MGKWAHLLATGLAVLLLAGSALAADELASVIAAKSAAADPGKPLSEVLALFDAAEAELKAADASAGSPAIRAGLHHQWGTLLSARGIRLGSEIRKDPGLLEQHRESEITALKGAVEMYKVAGKLGDQALKELPAAKRGGPEGRDLDWATRRSRFYVCTGEYQLGLAFPAGSTARADQCKAAIRVLQDFLWDNEDNLLGAFGYIYIGLAYGELGETRKAFDFLSVATASYPVPSRKDAENYGKWTDLFLQGYFKLAEYCNRLADEGGEDYRPKALKVLETMAARVPDCWQRRFGHLALIQEAVALKGTGKLEEAKAILERIIEEAGKLPADQEWGEGTAFLASQILAQMVAEGVLEATVEDLMKAAGVRKMTRDWALAEAAYLAVVTACETEDEIRQFAIPAWMEIGECCYRDERFEDAFKAYSQVFERYPKINHERGGDAAYYRYRAATALYAETRKTTHADLKQRARGAFAEGYPDHPRAIDLRYYIGADLISEGDRLMSEGDREAALEVYRDAWSSLESVSKKSSLYAKARARQVEVYFKTGSYMKALRSLARLQAYLDNPNHVTTDPQRLANRQAAGAVAIYYGAKSLEKQGEWERVIALLENFEQEYASEQVRNFHAPVKRLRSKARQELDASED